MISLNLSENWQFKQHDINSAVAEEVKADKDWLPAQVPGTVHTDLLAAERIPDPFYGLNEEAVQWVGERDWLYRTTFNKPAELSQGDTATLCFDGLDTFASVWLNDKQILVSDNMFVPQRVNVTELLQPTDNHLTILFESALRRGKELEAEYGQQKCWNGDTSRMYVRKAQYHYGWDWGPCLLTAGAWQPIRLEVWQARIADVAYPVELTPDLGQAVVKVRAQVETANLKDSNLNLHLQLFSPSNALVAEAKVPANSANSAESSLSVEKPELWWPNGYGAQPLYRLVVSLQDSSGSELDKVEKRVGLRRLQLVQEPISGESGKSFLFEINNTPIFCGGANWIPADNFTTRVTEEKYRNWLQLAVDANMVMLRVWGGGIYEYDVFYDLCDELGLLVWQDFMFACGIYPANDWFQESVRAEAEATVRRLRNHACIALWSGNNEDYMIAYSQNIYHPEESIAENKTFPARAIYEQLLPAVCAELDPTRPYWASSPYGGTDPNDQTVGDRHTWDVWHGAMADYHDYYRFEGRFVSEFGMAALPQLSTIETFAPPAERYPNSRTLEFHNKAGDGTRRISVYLADNLHQPTNLIDYIYATQFVQAEALTMAIRSWRRRWGGPNKYAVAGALVWQINDCWPVTSWAMADYDLNPKPAYYAVRRVLAPLTVEMIDLHNGTAAVWCVNSGPETVKATVELKHWTLDGANEQTKSYEVNLESNLATEVTTIPFKATEQLVVSAKLIRDGQILARVALWPEPFKYLHLPDPAIEVTRLSDNQVRVQSQRPAKGVVLAAKGVTSWSDNFLDVLPDDPQVITFKGDGTPEISISAANQLERA